MKRKISEIQDKRKYKKLGDRWRRPRGRQSKLRLGKRGNSLKPSIGMRTPKEFRGTIQRKKVVYVSSPEHLKSLDKGRLNKAIIILNSGLGLKKLSVIADMIEKDIGLKNVDILNRSILKKAVKKREWINKKKEKTKKEDKKEEKKKDKTEEKKKETKEEDKKENKEETKEKIKEDKKEEKKDDMSMEDRNKEEKAK